VLLAFHAIVVGKDIEGEWRRWPNWRTLGFSVTPDYYAVLGVGSDADQELIRSAYLALAKQYHPDSATAASPKNDEKFHSVSEAYENLRDPDRRREYDMRQARREQQRREARARAGDSRTYKPSASAVGSSQTKGRTGSAAEGNAARSQTRSPNWVRNLWSFQVGFRGGSSCFGSDCPCLKNPANIELRTDAAEERASQLPRRSIVAVPSHLVAPKWSRAKRIVPRRTELSLQSLTTVALSLLPSMEPRRSAPAQMRRARTSCCCRSLSHSIESQ
jgi:curved DNA-binding protein CbpA